MLRSILFVIAEGALPDSALEYAFWLARLGPSRIHGLAIIDAKAFEVPVLGTSDGFMPPVVAPPLTESRELLDELTETARERLVAFDRVCAQRGVAASTDLVTGVPDGVVCREAIGHDMVVMARSGYRRPGGEERVDPVVQAVVRGSVRPVLVAGAAFHEVRHVLVAYDGSAHSARSLAIAAELGTCPGIRVTVANIAPNEGTGVETLVPAAAYLCRHGVTPERRVVVGPRPADLLCELMSTSAADLLVMGAYGHAAIREMIMGSTTARVLSHCGTAVVLHS